MMHSRNYCQCPSSLCTSLRHVDVLDSGFVVIFLEGGKSRSSVVLRAAATLLVAKMLAGIGGK